MSHFSIRDCTIIRGRIQYADAERIIYTRLDKVFEAANNGPGKQIFKLNQQGYRLPFQRIVNRLLRRGYHHLLPLSNDRIFFIKDKSTFLFNKNKIEFKGNLKGSRPLSVLYFNNKIHYGEYRLNSERSKIGLFELDPDNGEGWKELLAFYGITHIHGVYEDETDHKIWITVGDDDNEAAIYCYCPVTKYLEKILSGSQQTRAIKLLFDQDHVFFGSDTPYDENYLYRYHKVNKSLLQICKVGSSVFHGCKVKNWFFFSTAIEPSKINHTRFAEVWASPNGREWRCIIKVKKDILPMRLFQYGQVFFPLGPGNQDKLWLSPFASKYDQKTIGIPIEYINGLFTSKEIWTL